MKEIVIDSEKHGQKIVLVDKKDFYWLNQWNWSVVKHGNTFYVSRSIRCPNNKMRTISMHRLILGLSVPNILCDHIDGNGLNNQRNNLRICNNAQNLYNKKSVKGSSSKYKGVWLHKKSKSWVAEIKENGKKRYLGYFKNEDEAAKMYNKAAIEIQGEFAYLNII